MAKIPMKPHVFPPSLLSQINENSGGGFFLLTIADTGEPVLNIQADNQMVKLGIIKFLANFFGAMDEYNSDDIRCELMGIDEEDFDDEDEEE